MNRLQHGFTMAEMMAVLAVIAILSMMAIPSFQDRIVRQQIESGLPLADLAKPPIAAAWAADKPLPVNNEAAGLPPAEKIVNNHVSAVTVNNGAIDVTFGNSAHKAISGKILTLRPAVVEDARIVPVAWVCGNAEAPEKMTLKGTNQTNIPSTFLPVACRAIKR